MLASTIIMLQRSSFWLAVFGALCVAAAADPTGSRDLFRKLLLWGLSMTLVGALLAQLLAGPLAKI